MDGAQSKHSICREIFKAIHMECPICDQIHDIEEKTRITSMIIKGEEVIYEERYCFRSNVNENVNEFENGNMTNANLANARNAYRLTMGMTIV